MSETTTHGEIFSETLPTLLRGHHERAETGTLTLRQGSVTKTLRLHRGVVVFAGSNERDDRRSLNEICEVVPLNDFVVIKVVWGLLAVGALMKA